MRVRFAPSPTGALHIGSARTALFNWLAARHEDGAFLLRIEDTDRERSTPENVEQIFDALRWLEIDWDGEPVFQSRRADRHAEVVAQLLEQGHAYRSTAGPEDVRAYKEAHDHRARRRHAGVPPRGRGGRPRRGHHARRPRRRPLLQHAEARPHPARARRG